MVRTASCWFSTCWTSRSPSRVNELLDESYGPASFAEFAANRLGVEFEPNDFKNSDFEQAAQYAKDRASRNIPSAVQAALDENLPAEEDEGEWQWQVLAGQMSRTYELKLTDRDLKKIGRDELPGWLIEKAEEQIQKVDLSDGAKYLQSDWGIRSVCDWVRLKFRIEIPAEELAGQAEDQVQAVIREKVRALYRQKEIEFPVQAAVAQFLGDKAPDGRGSALRPGGYVRLVPCAISGLGRRTVRGRFPHPAQEPVARNRHGYEPAFTLRRRKKRSTKN